MFRRPAGLPVPKIWLIFGHGVTIIIIIIIIIIDAEIKVTLSQAGAGAPAKLLQGHRSKLKSKHD